MFDEAFDVSAFGSKRLISCIRLTSLYPGKLQLKITDDLTSTFTDAFRFSFLLSQLKESKIQRILFNSKMVKKSTQEGQLFRGSANVFGPVHFTFTFRMDSGFTIIFNDLKPSGKSKYNPYAFKNSICKVLEHFSYANINY